MYVYVYVYVCIFRQERESKRRVLRVLRWNVRESAERERTVRENRRGGAGDRAGGRKPAGKPQPL